jgi:hypothetical protein
MVLLHFKARLHSISKTRTGATQVILTVAIAIEWRYANGDYDKVQAFVEEFVKCDGNR